MYSTSPERASSAATPLPLSHFYSAGRPYKIPTSPPILWGNIKFILQPGGPRHPSTDTALRGHHNIRQHSKEIRMFQNNSSWKYITRWQFILNNWLHSKQFALHSFFIDNVRAEPSGSDLLNHINWVEGRGEKRLLAAVFKRKSTKQ